MEFGILAGNTSFLTQVHNHIKWDKTKAHGNNLPSNCSLNNFIMKSILVHDLEFQLPFPVFMYQCKLCNACVHAYPVSTESVLSNKDLCLQSVCNVNLFDTFFFYSISNLGIPEIK